MATRWAVLSGNWSSTSTWDGGTLPTSADDVYADGKTVTIDQNITVLSLRTTQRSGGTNGGGFTLNNGIEITCTGAGIFPGSSNCVNYSGASATTIRANVWANASGGGSGINITGAGGLNLIGNATAENIGNATSHAVNSSNGWISITGNVTGGAGTSGGSRSCGVNTSGIDSWVSVTGNVFGRQDGSVASGPQLGAIFTTGINAYVTVIGEVKGALQGGGGYGVYTSGANAYVSVTGNVTAQGGPGIVTAGSSATRINSIIGNITSGTGVNGVSDSNTSGGWTVVGGSLIDSPQGDVAVLARRVRHIPTLNTYIQHTNNTGYPNGNPVFYGSLDYIPNNVPAPSNVRNGISFANNEQIGTCIIPAAESVAYGVPVDNTTGTSAISAAAITSLLTAQLTAALNP